MATGYFYSPYVPLMSTPLAYMQTKPTKLRLYPIRTRHADKLKDQAIIWEAAYRVTGKQRRKTRRNRRVKSRHIKAFCGGQLWTLDIEEGVTDPDIVEDLVVVSEKTLSIRRNVLTRYCYYDHRYWECTYNFGF
jgi:hypothetical protein